jgi:MarR family transcriptional regulator, organic hydroperoxide resistance regulator
MPASPDSAVGFFENYLPHLLTLAAIATSRAFDHELRERGVSLPVWRVMAVLFERPGETVTGLAKRCLLQQPTMTKLLDRMESDRLVRRSPDKQDQRVVRVSLTKKGPPSPLRWSRQQSTMKLNFWPATLKSRQSRKGCAACSQSMAG